MWQRHCHFGRFSGQELKGITESCNEIFQRSENKLHVLTCWANHRKKAGNIIILCGTYDISKDANLEKVAADIINLSKSVSEESRSNIIRSFSCT